MRSISLPHVAQRRESTSWRGRERESCVTISKVRVPLLDPRLTVSRDSCPSSIQASPLSAYYQRKRFVSILFLWEIGLVGVAGKGLVCELSDSLVQLALPSAPRSHQGTFRACLSTKRSCFGWEPLGSTWIRSRERACRLPSSKFHVGDCWRG